MEAHEEELIQRLAPAHPELQSAYEEHGRLKSEVEQLTAKAFLAPEDEVRKKELQKLKLAVKDRIIKMLAEHRNDDEHQTA
jgi:uncharacterized protein YdcH (DUF465 family)